MAAIRDLIEKWAALYVRLSRDDDNEGDSNSIAHQIEILKKYAKERGITSYKIYKDDGYSGTSFNRPGFQEMLADIEAGLVSMVIVKDMSRFGRNYLEVGLYTEIRFPELGVRFIAGQGEGVCQNCIAMMTSGRHMPSAAAFSPCSLR